MNKLCVLIDNGHGVDTPGKRSPDGRLLEWKWTREFAKLLSEKLTQIGISNVLLVTEDKDVSLKSRCEREKAISNNLKSNGLDTIFISIHVNAGPKNEWSNASGVTVHVYEKGSAKSKKLGAIYSDYTKKMKLTGNRYIPQSGYFPCNFYVCKNTSSPAILVEHMFMTNKDDVEYLLSDKGKNDLIQLHINSILEYMKIYSYNG